MFMFCEKHVLLYATQNLQTFALGLFSTVHVASESAKNTSRMPHVIRLQ